MNNVKLIIYPPNAITETEVETNLDSVYVENNSIVIDVNFLNDAISLNYSIADVKDISKKNTSFSKTINIPASKLVNTAFDSIFELRNFTTFNPNKKIDCQIIQDNLSILTGYLQLRKVNYDLNNEVISYETVVYSSEDNLIRQITGLELTDLDLSDYNYVYNATGITHSWTNETGNGIVHPIIDYGKNWTYNNIRLGGYGYLNLGDLKPAIYLKSITDAIINQAGFSYTSEFFDSDYYKKIIMPLTNFKLSKDESEGYKAKAICTGQTFNISPAQYYTEVIIFTDDSINGFDYSNSYNNLTGEYTFNNAKKASVNTTLTIYSNEFDAFNIHLRKYDSATGLYSNIYSTGYNTVQANSYNTFTVNTPEFVFQTNDKLCIAVERTSILAQPFIMAGSLIEINISDEIVLGSTVDVSTILPPNIKQIEFLSSVLKTFNIYFEADLVNHKNILFETRNDFYTKSDILDWSNKLDISKITVQDILPELQAKNIILSFTPDKDYFNELYTVRKDKIYGEKKVTVDNDFLSPTSELKIQPLFSPTVVSKIAGSNIIIPKIFKADNSNIAQPIESKPRLLFFSGLYSADTFYVGTGSGTTAPTNYYPFTSHLDDPYVPSYDLNFDAPEEIYFPISGTVGYNQYNYTDNNLYKQFYEKTIEEITSKESRLLTAYFYLTPADLVNLSFRKAIRVNGQLYKLNRIIDYNPLDNSSTKVELLKSINTTPTYFRTNKYKVPKSEVDVTSGRINLGRNTTILEPFNIAVGDNNTTGSDSEGNLVIGQSNNLLFNSSNSVITGFQHSGLTNNGLIIGGSGNSLSFENTNSSIIGSRDSKIDASGETNSGVILAINSTIDNDSNNNIILAGKENIISGSNSYSAVIGGTGNTVYNGLKFNTIQNSQNSYIKSGSYNLINTASNSQIKTNSSRSSIINGISNIISNSNYSSIISGNDNIITSGRYSSILNGKNNSLGGFYSSIIGSKNATLNSKYSAVIGGVGNKIESSYAANSFVGAGNNNSVNGQNSAVLAGSNNYITAGASYAAIIGGSGFTASTSHKVYVPLLQIYNLASGGTYMVTSDASGTLYYSDIPSGSTGSSGSTSASTVGLGTSLINTISANTIYLKSLSGGNLTNIRDVNNSTLVIDHTLFQNGTGTKSVKLSGTSSTASNSYGISLGNANTNSGQYSTIINGTLNTITSNFSILNGRSNTIAANYSVIGGGKTNTITSTATTQTIAGGYQNSIKGTGSHNAILGGATNVVSGTSFNTIGGGQNNLIEGSIEHAFIGGGNLNKILRSSLEGVIGGGLTNNIINSTYSFIGGGRGNYISGNSITQSLIGGGFSNRIYTSRSVIAGGYNNKITGVSNAVIGGGANNLLSGSSSYATIAGGRNNKIYTSFQGQTIGGGRNNIIFNNSASLNTIGGGYNNKLYGSFATIGGGTSNRIGTSSGVATNSSIGGGGGNFINSSISHATIAGGSYNSISGGSSNISGGLRNSIATSSLNVIGGGSGNTIGVSSNYASLFSGKINSILSSPYSFISSGWKNSITNGSHHIILGGHNNVINSANTSHIAIVNCEYVTANTPFSTYVSQLFLMSATTGGTHLVAYNANSDKKTYYKSLSAGTNVEILDNGSTITINASGGTGSGSSGSSGISGTAGSSGSSGVDGISGVDGMDGSNSTRFYFDDSIIAYNDPTSTNFISDDTDFSLVTKFSISKENINSADVYNWLLALHNFATGTTPYLQIYNVGNTSRFGIYRVTRTWNNTTYFDIEVQYIAGNSLLSTGQIYSISFVAHGNSGSSGVSGTSGTAGSSGINGTSGSAGSSGVNGTSGSSGINGTSGSSGVNGTSGSSGVNGTSGSAGSAGTSGTSGTSGTISGGQIVLINKNETDVTGTASNASAKSYSLASNSYSEIMVETEVGFTGTANATNEVYYYLQITGTTKESISLRQDATGAGDFWKLAAPLKFSESCTGGGTLAIGVSAVTGSATWAVKSLRIYGIT